MPVNSFDDYVLSWKPERKEIKSPKYLSLANLLEKEIKNGSLKPGTKLPPQRELADYLDMNLSTITRAFKLCSMKGLISSAVGSGTFVASDATSNHMMLHESESKLIEMGAILPDVRGNQRVFNYIHKVITEEAYLNSMQYALPEGNARQKAAARKWLKCAQMEVDEGQILISNGGQNAISAILSGIFQRGDTIGTNSCIYPGFKSTAKMLGIKVVPIAEENYELNREGIIYACKNENLKGIYIIPDYSNPTTHTMSLRERKMIADVAKEYDLIVIEDAINAHLREMVLPAVAAYAPENTIHIASLSKIFSPGLRLAYIAVPERYRAELLNALYCLNISVSMLMVEVATRLIETGEGELIANERRNAVVHRNQKLNQMISNIPILGDDVCSFRWLLLPKEFSGKSFELCAKSLGVQVFSSEQFAVGSVPVQNAVRLAIPSANSDTEFEKGIQIIKSLLETEDHIEFIY